MMTVEKLRTLRLQHERRMGDLIKRVERESEAVRAATRDIQSLRAELNRTNPQGA